MLVFGFVEEKLEKVAAPPSLPQCRMPSISTEISSAFQDYLILSLDPSRPRPLPAQEWYRRLSGETSQNSLCGSPASSWHFKYMLPCQAFMWVVGIQTQVFMRMLNPFTIGTIYPPQTCFFINQWQNCEQMIEDRWRELDVTFPFLAAVLI